MGYNARNDEIRDNVTRMRREWEAQRGALATVRRFNATPAVRGWQVCRMHGARGGAPEGKRNGNYRHGARSKETIEIRKLIKSLR